MCRLPFGLGARGGVRVSPFSGKIQEVFTLGLSFTKPSVGPLKMGTDSVSETLEKLLLNFRTLSAREDSIEFCRRKSFRS